MLSCQDVVVRGAYRCADAAAGRRACAELGAGAQVADAFREHLKADEGAEYDQLIEIDLNELQPQARPGLCRPLLLQRRAMQSTLFFARTSAAGGLHCVAAPFHRA